MASIVTANFNRDNVTPISRERTADIGASCRICRQQHASCVSEPAGVRADVARTEPSSSIAKRVFDIAAASGALAVLRAVC